MGQSKRNRARLGAWYGKPIVLGHPDFVAPDDESATTAQGATTSTASSKPSPDVDGCPGRPLSGRASMTMLASMFMLGLSYVDLGPEPVHRPKKRSP